MARSKHSVLSAPDRFERRAARRPRPSERRVTTRSAIIRREIEAAV